MTDDYNLAKPDPLTGHLPPDLSGFVAGTDRTKSAPELLADLKALHANRDEIVHENAWLHAEIEYLRSKLARLHAEPITGDTSDGHHTFNDLYTHRRALTAALMAMAEKVTDFVTWRSRNHHPEDGPMFDGSFIVGLEIGGGTITYHYNNQYWDDFKNVRELPHAPKWDGEGPAETITRLLDFAKR